ncbi:PREDICTED: sphingosine-1-phosphate lyase [Ceratosolen solmsi marchali]|uniref:sphinganine-1-phosphate aldolase n=1 Tax=Ceratosolen solmsi marchali TaxID=326594 RepID=A0AAJ6YGR1_9HYME|nr:PREDICTED: sphingosine-1-phosphate lyase [Ceratosolen solmsi marchali]
MNVINFISVPAKNTINQTFKGKEPWEIAGMTSITILTVVWFYNFIFQEESIVERIKKSALKMVRRIPAVRNKINSELKCLSESFEEEAINRTKALPYITSLPNQGIDLNEILKLVESSVYLGNYDWKNGRVSGCVYRNAETDLRTLVKEVYSLASLTNPLHPDIFPGVCKMEAEVVRIACQLFNGDGNSCGTMTTGGTESILMACKAFRDYARDVKGITRPEMVMPVTAHSAFDKAAQYLKIRVRAVQLDPDSYTVNIAAMKRAITRNTIMLVCSAPNFPYGTMDDIEAIAKLGLRYNVPVHVDACLGGFLICFMRAAGYSVPEFDFRLEGVCSISADTHKYGYAPKGSSVVLYRDKKYRHHQFTITTDWLGGIYGSPTVNGSRAGGIIAACWATLLYFGHEGYVQSTKKVIDTTRFIEQELRKMDGIYVFGTPVTSVIAIGSKFFDIYRLSQALNSRGWNLNPLQFPSALHICVTHVHTEPGVAQQFVHDMKEDVATILRNPSENAKGMYAIYGSSQSIADRSIVGEITKYFLDAVYYTPKEECTTVGKENRIEFKTSNEKLNSKLL